MKPRHLIAAFVVAASVVSTAALQDASRLRLSLAEGRKDVFTIKSEMKQTLDMAGMGQQEMTITSGMKMAVETGKKGEDGKASIEMAVSDFEMKLEGMPGAPDMPNPGNYVIKGKIDELGRITDTKIEGAEASMAQMMNASSQQTPYFVVFPDKDVKVGDSWKIPIPKNDLAMTADSELTAKLLGEKTVKDVVVFEIQLMGDVLVDGDPSKANPDVPFAMKTKGKVSMDGLYWVEKSSGRTIGYQTKMRSDMTMELTDMGMTISTKGSGTMTMDWVK